MPDSFLGWPDDEDETPAEGAIKTIAVVAPAKCETCGHDPCIKRNSRTISMEDLDAEKERREKIHSAALEGCARVCKKKALSYWNGAGHGAAFVALTVVLGAALAFVVGLAH